MKALKRQTKSKCSTKTAFLPDGFTFRGGREFCWGTVEDLVGECRHSPSLYDDFDSKCLHPNNGGFAQLREWRASTGLSATTTTERRIA